MRVPVFPPETSNEINEGYTNAISYEKNSILDNSLDIRGLLEKLSDPNENFKATRTDSEVKSGHLSTLNASHFWYDIKGTTFACYAECSRSAFLLSPTLTSISITKLKSASADTESFTLKGSHISYKQAGELLAIFDKMATKTKNIEVKKRQDSFNEFINSL